MYQLEKKHRIKNSINELQLSAKLNTENRSFRDVISNYVYCNRHFRASRNASSNPFFVAGACNWNNGDFFPIPFPLSFFLSCLATINGEISSPCKNVRYSTAKFREEIAFSELWVMSHYPATSGHFKFRAEVRLKGVNPPDVISARRIIRWPKSLLCASRKLFLLVRKKFICFFEKVFTLEITF